MKQLLHLVVLLFLTLSLEAKTATKTVSGYGETQQLAISNALLQAVSQVNGVSVDSIDLMRSRFREIRFSYDGKKGYIRESDNGSGGVLNITKGIVKSYDVKSVKKVDDSYKAVVDVVLSQYEAADTSYKNKVKLAIMPFYMYQHTYQIGHQTYGSVVVTEQLQDALVSSFVHSKKVTVLDRAYSSDMNKELRLISSRETALSEKVKMGQKLGADYILVGTIEKADIKHTTVRNQSLGTSKSSNSLESLVSYRLIVVGTSHIKYTNKVKVSTAVVDSEDALSTLIKEVSQKISLDILDDMYPIRIAQITASRELILNQGGDSMYVGMKMDVMKLGEEIIDTYTKESLGRSESKIAKIEITKVTPRVSYAKVIEGSANSVHVNDICRRDSTSTSSVSTTVADNPNWKKSNVSVSKGGGVKLGF